MKIAYVVPFRGGRETGIYRKVAEHASEWARQGATVGVFVATNEAAVDDWSSLPATQRVVTLPGHPAATLVARESLLRSVRAWSPDVVYARHGLVYPGLLWMAARIPTVLEINSNDVTEFGATSPWRARYARTTRDLLLGRAQGLVFVTEELAVAREFSRGPERRATIANGIHLHDFPQHPAPTNDKPHIVFIGHPGSKWHGLDQLMLMASRFPEWAFDVIGSNAADLGEPPSNVRAHGTLVREDYDPILRRADVAVGTLALHIQHMQEASPLKVREYLARGIPTIVGYRDTDFPNLEPFLLRIPNASDGVATSLEQIAEFVAKSVGTRVPRDSIAHLDVGAKEQQRLQFLEDVVAARRTVES